MSEFDLLQFMPFRLNRLAAEVSNELASVYAERFAISIAEWRIIATLGAQGPSSATLIVKSTRTHKSRISRGVSRLHEIALVEGVESVGDRREVQLRLTRKGRLLYKQIVPLIVKKEREMLACLNTDELRAFSKAMAKFEAALGMTAGY
jgi:DNA-binding MarR family transcriptional regulator